MTYFYIKKMKRSIDWHKLLFITAVVLLVAGAVDPLEGSVVIAGGSILLSGLSWQNHDRHRRIFAVCALLILFGVAWMFWISSKGGIGGTSGRSWWWGTPILTYPIGWIVTIGTLLFRLRKPSQTAA